MSDNHTPDSKKRSFQLSDSMPPLPKPKPFHITEPVLNNGLWSFWLTAEDEVLAFVQNLHCMQIAQKSRFGSSRFQAKLSGRAHFTINPRYNHDEIWAWLHEVLTAEANTVALSDSWESAIEAAHAHTDDN